MFKKAIISFRNQIFILTICLGISLICSDLLRFRQSNAASLGLPEPNQMITTSVPVDAMVLKGLSIDVNDPLNLSFIVENHKPGNNEQLDLIVKYFLAALTVPESDLWVNLSPYESNRVIADVLNDTDLGKALLEQDYLLKLYASSLTDPDTPLGADYWSSQLIQGKEIDYANKVWIVPNKAEIYEKGTNVLITKSDLKVETEETSVLDCESKQSLINEIEKEINAGRRFVSLRQIYNSVILAKWFKAKFKESFYKYYIDSNNVSGISLEGEGIRDKVFNLYCESFRKGVYKKLKNVKYSRINRNYLCGGINYSVKMASSINADNVSTEYLKILKVNLNDFTKASQEEVDIYRQIDFDKALDIVDAVKEEQIVEPKSNDKRIYNFFYGEERLNDMYFERAYYSKYGMFKVLSKSIKLGKHFRDNGVCDFNSDKVWVRFIVNEEGQKCFTLHLRPGAREIGRWYWDEEDEVFKNFITPSLKIKQTFELTGRYAAEYVGKALDVLRGTKENLTFKMKVSKANKVKSKSNTTWNVSAKLRFTVKGKSYYISSPKFKEGNFVYLRVNGKGEIAVYLDEECTDLVSLKYFDYKTRAMSNSNSVGFENYFDWVQGKGPCPADIVLPAQSYANTESQYYTNRLPLLDSAKHDNRYLKLLCKEKLENNNVLVSFRYTRDEQKAIYVHTLGEDNAPKQLVYKGYYNHDKDEFISLIDRAKKISSNELHLLLIKLERYFPNSITELAAREFCDFVDYMREEEKRIKGPYLDVYDFDDIVVNKILKIKNFDYMQSTFLEQLQIAKVQALRFRMYNYLFSEFDQVFTLLKERHQTKFYQGISNLDTFYHVRFKEKSFDEVIEKLETLPLGSEERFRLYRDYVRDENFRNIIVRFKQEDKSGRLKRLHEQYERERTTFAKMCLNYKYMFLKKYGLLANSLFKGNYETIEDLNVDMLYAAYYAAERYDVGNDYLVKSFVYQYFEKHNALKYETEKKRMRVQDAFERSVESEIIPTENDSILSKIDQYSIKDYVGGHSLEKSEVDSLDAFVADILHRDSDILSSEEKNSLSNYLYLKPADGTSIISNDLKLKIKDYIVMKGKAASSSISLIDNGGIDMSSFNINTASSAINYSYDWSVLNSLSFSITALESFKQKDKWW